MKQEYLFANNDNKAELHKYDPNSNLEAGSNIKVTFKDVIQSNAFILTFELNGDSEFVAKNLSVVDQYITEHYKPIVLESGISAYFDRILYPKVNKFERLLRELLYLMATINQDKSASDNIKDLEQKDFGGLFELLFTDNNFVDQVKSRIKRGSGKFSKRQLVNEINEIAENTTWNKLSGDKFSPTLAENFEEIKDYRNDVMHAHNIGYDRFKAGNDLLDNTNKELQSAINNIIGAKEAVPEDFNNNLYAGIEAIAKAMDMLTDESKLEKVIQTLSAYTKALDQVVQKVGLETDPTKDEKEQQ